jgi:transposase-like protein
MLTEIPTPPTQGGGTEGGRRPTGVPAPCVGRNFTPEGQQTRRPDGSASATPNPEVILKAERRRFTKAYKLDILRQADACSDTGQIGALLRREGLFSSYLANWRAQRRQGLLDNSATKRRLSTPTIDNARIRQLERDNTRLAARLHQAELILDIQKKVSAILAIPLKPLDSEGSDS